MHRCPRMSTRPPRQQHLLRHPAAGTSVTCSSRSPANRSPRQPTGRCNATGSDSVLYGERQVRQNGVSYMRHRIGIILAVIMAGGVFFPGAWGYLRLLRFSAPVGQLSHLPGGGGSLISDNNVLIALAAITGTGLLAGIFIAAPRISPLAAGLPGLLMLGWTGLYLGSVRRGVDLIPLRSSPFGAGFEALLFSGILGAAGLAMILPMFVPSRWRASKTDESEATEADEFISSLGETKEAPVPTNPADRPTQLTPDPNRQPGAGPGGGMARHQQPGKPASHRTVSQH